MLDNSKNGCVMLLEHFCTKYCQYIYSMSNTGETRGNETETGLEDILTHLHHLTTHALYVKQKINKLLVGWNEEQILTLLTHSVANKLESTHETDSTDGQMQAQK